jgi:hypothetical protein
MNEVTNEEHSLLDLQRFFEKTWGQTKGCVLAAHHGGKTLDNYNFVVAKVEIQDWQGQAVKHCLSRNVKSHDNGSYNCN